MGFAIRGRAFQALVSKIIELETVQYGSTQHDYDNHGALLARAPSKLLLVECGKLFDARTSIVDRLVGSSSWIEFSLAVVLYRACRIFQWACHICEVCLAMTFGSKLLPEYSNGQLRRAHYLAVVALLPCC